MIAANSKDSQGAQNDPIMFPTMRPLERAPERGGNTLILCFNIQQTAGSAERQRPVQSVEEFIFLQTCSGADFGTLCLAFQPVVTLCKQFI